jgi:hypothetical protein
MESDFKYSNFSYSGKELSYKDEISKTSVCKGKEIKGIWSAFFLGFPKAQFIIRLLSGRPNRIQIWILESRAGEPVHCHSMFPPVWSSATKILLVFWELLG